MGYATKAGLKTELYTHIFQHVSSDET